MKTSTIQLRRYVVAPSKMRSVSNGIVPRLSSRSSVEGGATSLKSNGLQVIVFGTDMRKGSEASEKKEWM